jgi:hypothetical protein
VTLGSATWLSEETLVVLRVFLAKPAKEDAKLAKKKQSVIRSSLAPLAFLARENKSPQTRPPSRELEPSRLRSVA